MSVSAPANRIRFVLTGPTGWIGRALLAVMHTPGDPDALAPGEELVLFGSRKQTIATCDGRKLAVRPLTEIAPEDVAGAYVIHLAYLTKDKVGALGEMEFRETNTAIDNALLAAISAASPASLFVASSGAAQLAESGRDDHPYGLAKLEQEARFLNWAQHSGIPTLCGRIFNVAGPHINKLDSYAISNFAVQALCTGTIAIEARQQVYRTFLHVNDLARIVLRAARCGLGRTRPLDLCGAGLLEMQDIANLVAKSVGGDVAIARPPVNLASRSDYVGRAEDTHGLAMELKIGLKPVAVQIEDTVEWIRETFDVSLLKVAV